MRRAKERGRRHMTWVLGGALMLVIIATAAGFEDPHGVGYDGRGWKAISEQAKLAYVAGFLAGAATQQAVAMPPGNPQGTVDAGKAESPRPRTGTVPFRVGDFKNDLH